MISVIEIIEKNEKDRTKDELLYCFDILYKSDNTVTKYLEYSDIPNFNEILNNLRLLSKSRFFTFEWCPFRFKCSYIVKYRVESNLKIMVDGSNLHLNDQQFWESIKPDEFMIQNERIFEFIFHRCLSLIPITVELDEFNIKMIKAFSGFESKRIIKIFEEKGQTIETIKKYVIPIIIETKIENWSRKLMGIIDRGDMLTNDTHALVEYKYGKPKFWETYKEKAILDELAFYNILVQGKEVYAIEKKDGKDICIPLEEKLGFTPKFYYGSMLFFQDLKNTGHLFKITNSKMRGILTRIKKFWNAIETGQFPAKGNDSCYQWCPYYWDLCEHNEFWKNIDRSVEE